MTQAESAYHEPYEEYQEYDPEELGQEQQWEQEQKSKSHHEDSLFLSVIYERYDVSFH